MPTFEVVQPDTSIYQAEEPPAPMGKSSISPERLAPLLERISKEELVAVYTANENLGTVRAFGLSMTPPSRGLAELYALLDYYDIPRKHKTRGQRKQMKRTTTPNEVAKLLTPRPEATATKAEIEMAKALYPLLRPMILKDLRGALTLAETVG